VRERADSEQLPAVLAAAVGRADPDRAPFAALLTALTELGGLVADEHAAERRAIVAASPELQEPGADQVRRRHQRTSRGARAAGGRGGDRRAPRAGWHRDLPGRVRPLGGAAETREPGRPDPRDGGRASRQHAARRPAGRPAQPTGSRAGDLTPPTQNHVICAGIRPSTAVLRDTRIQRYVWNPATGQPRQSRSVTSRPTVKQLLTAAL
jgi:hypothetical protein